MNERLDSEETIQKNTAPKSIQLGFGWAPPSSNLKQSLSKSLVQEKFTDGFLTSLFSQSRKSEGSRFIQNIIDKDSDLIFIKDRDQRFAMANTSIGGIRSAKIQ